MLVKILEDKFIIGSFVFKREELKLIIDDVPGLPQGVVSLYYDGEKTTQSTGKSSKVIIGPWPEVDNLVQNVNTLIQEANKLREVDREIEDLTLEQVLADHRYAVEVGGITIGSLGIQTQRSTRADILGARIEAEADSSYTLEWKTENGFVTLDAATLILASSVVSAHVKECFSVEKRVLALIEDNTLTTASSVTDKFDEYYATWLAALYASLST